MRCSIPVACILLIFLTPNGSRCEEVQAHGVKFEAWVRDTFFDGYEGDYTQKWDISAQANNSKLTPKQGIPISIKLLKNRSPIGMGDGLRQRKLNEEFLLIVGFWEQQSKTEKRIVEVECLHVNTATWTGIWGGLDSDKLRELDLLVKALPHYQQARTAAQQWKRDVLPGLNCRMVINPKIDSKSQRRVQCSMPYKLFWELAGREPVPKASVSLFGETIPNPIYSKPRTFSK